MTKQPRWKMLANLGDVNPVEYGGYFIYQDMTGVYPAEGEWLEAPGSDDDVWRVYRFILDKCTFVNGILSDNKYHPEHKAWFADYIPTIAEIVGESPEKVIANLCSEDPLHRAWVYREIGLYCGFENLDSYPRTYTKKSALPRRIRRFGERKNHAR